MAFNWREYLDLAKCMAGKGISYTEDAALRCATSKAYFAAYCYARNYAIINLGFIPKNNYEDHARVKDHFKINEMVWVARALTTLRDWRNSCDYDDDSSDLKTLSSNAVNIAQNIFNNIISY